MNKYKRVVIVANGSIIQPEFYRVLLRESDFIIAVDGGIKHLEKIGILPHLIIGDFDSIGLSILDKYRNMGINIKKFPKDKDYTDTELALHEAKTISSNVILIGAFGKRIDHTIANIYLLYEARELGINMEIMDAYHRLFLIGDGERKVLPGDVGDIVSIIPMLPSSGIVTFGLKYPLQRESIRFGYARGISNVKIDKDAWVSIEKGALLIFIVKKEVEG